MPSASKRYGPDDYPGQRSRTHGSRPRIPAGGAKVTSKKMEEYVPKAKKIAVSDEIRTATPKKADAIEMPWLHREERLIRQLRNAFNRRGTDPCTCALVVAGIMVVVYGFMLGLSVTYVVARALFVHGTWKNLQPGQNFGCFLSSDTGFSRGLVISVTLGLITIFLVVYVLILFLSKARYNHIWCWAPTRMSEGISRTERDGYVEPLKKIGREDDIHMV